jgi:hypothetical protein
MQEEMIEDVPLEKCQSTWLCYEGAYKAYRKPKENWYPMADPNLRKPSPRTKGKLQPWSVLQKGH